MSCHRGPKPQYPFRSKEETRATYLLDDTGNRRFWPIKVEVTQIDIDGLRREIAQIWAEAVEVYRAMRAVQPECTLPLYLTSERAQEIALEAQEARRQQTEADGYLGILAVDLDVPYAPDPMEPDVTVLHDKITTTEIWNRIFGNSGVPNRSAEMELGKAMKKLGWDRKKVRRGKALVWAFHRPETDGSELI